MKILLAGKFVPSGHRPIGGLQTWIATVRRELERLGHTCTEWQHGWNIPAAQFDLGILANMDQSRNLLKLSRRNIAVCHGIIKAEAPGSHADVDKQVFVSEGVRQHWGIAGAVVPQPIDLSFWCPGEDDVVQPVLTRYSYRRSATRCREVSQRLKLQFQHIHSCSALESRNLLRRSTVVLASGRAALEAMACGVPTVVYDHRSAYQGPLLDTDLERQLLNSYSGRGGVDPSLDDLLAACKASRGRVGWVQRNHCARTVVQELLQ